MQTFIDTVTKQVYYFDADVQSVNTAGVYSFVTNAGVLLSNLPTTLQPYTVPPTPAVDLLLQAQQAKNNSLVQSYSLAATVPIAFTAGVGTSATYATDPGSISSFQSVLLAFAPPAALPVGFYWVAQDNSAVPFTYADVQALSKAIGDRNFALFTHLQALKNQVRAATTPAAVALITW